MAFFQIFKTRNGQFRWRLRADNNKIIADSTESYIRKSDCKQGIEILKLQSSEAKVKDKTIPGSK